MDQKIRSTKCFMVNKGIEIDVNNNWFQNCVQWFVAENSRAGINELHTFVYDQFLLADLRDVQLNCLPGDLSNHAKLMLQGKYTLQVDSIQDVSQSCYSQIQTIQGTGKNTNVENQDARSRNHADSESNVKSSHMLKLNMTDGVQRVFGMEYDTLGQIREGFIPGCKVVISGPIEVRRGVFLLKAANFHLLGGELDSIIIQNSVENVLARILNLNENPNAGPINIFNNVSDYSATQTQTSQRPLPSQPQNTANHVAINQSHNTNNSARHHSSNQEYISHQSSATNELRPSDTLSNSTHHGHNSIPRTEIDDWEDDDLMDMHVWNDIESTLNLPSNSNATPHSNEGLSASNPSCQNSSSPSHQSNNLLPGASIPNLNPDRQKPPNTSSSNSSTLLNNYPSSSNQTQNNSTGPDVLNRAPSGSNLKRYPSPDLTPPAKRYAQNISLPSLPHALATPPTTAQPIRIDCNTSHPPSTHTLAPPPVTPQPIRISLSRIKTSPPPLPFSMVFRECKVKTMEKLSVSKGIWKLPATITDDGVEFLSVDFSDPVIFKISGVSAAELQSKKKQVTTDPELRKTLEQMVQNIRTQILNYIGPMKISFTSSQKPTVVSLPK